MKKSLLLILVSISIFTLSSCSQNPFNALPNTEIINSNTLEFNYYNGKTTEKLFEYTFSKEYYYFVGILDNNYRFTAINNYLDISNEFIDFLEYYDDYIVYDKFINDSYGDKVRLSLGATDGNFNLTNISIDNNIYDVDAYMSIENGLRIVFSYTEFYHNDELIIIPYYLSIIAYDIHEAYLKEYLPVNNDYVPEKAILTKYITHIIPLPPKVSILSSSFDENDNDLKNLGYYMKIIEDTSTNEVHTEKVCSEEITESCFEKEFSVVKGYIYDYSIDEILNFYELNYNGQYDGENFIFINNNLNYKIILGEKTTIRIYNVDDNSSQLEDVINFEITYYNN